MPIVPYNQTKHSDVCQYLEYVENFLMDVFKPENEPDIPNEKKEEKAKQKDRILKESSFHFVVICWAVKG